MATAQYWRVRFSAGNGADIWLSEVEFYSAVPAMISTAGGTAISGGNYSGYLASAAFDGVKTTANSGWASAAVPGWIGMMFPSAVAVDSVKVYIYSGASASDELPVLGSVYLEWSTDGSTWNDTGHEFLGTFAVGGMIEGAVPAIPSFTVGRAQAIDVETSGPDAATVNIARRVGGADIPQRAKVTLLRRRDMLPVRQGWADDAGAITFNGINLEVERYIALTEYPGNPDNPASEDYLRPVTGVTKIRGEA